nr:uncharacterized protein LOC113692207 [Coffea arabica]
MITHGGLIHNVKLMRRRYRSTSRTILVSWLPQYHDMGLIGGLLTSMGSTVVVAGYQQNHATHTAGPNFAFELLVRKLELNKVQNFDLSSLVFLMTAAEPIRPATLKRFIELTQAFGLSQENVDPETGKELEKSENEGEVWVSSLSSGVGYWDMKELSETTFRNKLDNHSGKLYLRTGDLGRVIEDIEKTVESSSEILRPGCCAAVSVPSEILLAKGISVPDVSDQIALVVIAEVRETKFSSQEVVKKIETRVAEEHGVIVAATVLIKPRSIAKLHQER